MKTQLKIFVSGANGRMGQSIIKNVIEDDDLYLAGASENSESPVLGADAGLNAGTKQASVSITSDLRRPLEKHQGVIIDFSSLEATLENLKRAIEFKTPMIIGTTGFKTEQIKIIHEAGEHIPVMFAPNMSVGMNVVFSLLQTAARVLQNDYDMEVVELHHKDKLDSPSGTAMKIVQVLAEASGRSFTDDVIYDRHSRRQKREKNEIGVQALRGGDVVGEHTVYFMGEGERLEIKHVATNRLTFATGAICAAKWIFGKPAGIYDMQDVLGLKANR